jgi:segregation and condensation protein B
MKNRQERKGAKKLAEEVIESPVVAELEVDAEGVEAIAEVETTTVEFTDVTEVAVPIDTLALEVAEGEAIALAGGEVTIADIMDEAESADEDLIAASDELDEAETADEGLAVAAEETESTGEGLASESDEAADRDALASDPTSDDATALEAVASEAPAPDAATAVAPPSNLVTDFGEILQAVEAIVFASPKAISVLRIKNLLTACGYATDSVGEALAALEAKFQDSGFTLVKVAGGYQFRSHPKTSDVLQRLLEDKPARLSGSALEVLAIVAYKQPVTRAEIDIVRGIDSGHLMKGLLEKNLVRTVGHAETPGRPLLYGTTPYFLEVFGLGSLDEMPSTEEFTRELVASDAGDSAAGDGEGAVVLAADELLAAAAFHSSDSPLAATPDRGDFDRPDEESFENADFGVEERAKEEVAASQ